MPNKRWIIHRRPTRPVRVRALDADTGQSYAAFDRTHAAARPAIYHCVSRVVDKRFVFGDREKDKFVEYMRMYESFAGIRVLAHCVMSNHFHLMLEITPFPDEGIPDDELLNRLSAIYDEATVGAVEMELKAARCAIAEGRADESRANEIRERYLYRMHDLSEFMKSLVQRFTQWYNRCNGRKGNLWEDNFRSIIVEPGAAARLVAAYIDLNPVRAGIVADPAEYRWCSYGEAHSGKQHHTRSPSPVAQQAREGLVRAFFAHQGGGPDAGRWMDCHAIYRPWIEETMARIRALRSGNATRKHDPGGGASPGQALAGRIRHFTDGVAVGGSGFVNDLFHENRRRFGPKRTTGARPIRGNASAVARSQGICTLRDLQKNIGE